MQSDVLSILSCSEINDDDKRKLIEEMSSGNIADDGGNTRSNINVKLNTKNIFSRFTSPGITDTNGSNENYNNLKNEVVITAISRGNVTHLVTQQRNFRKSNNSKVTLRSLPSRVNTRKPSKAARRSSNYPLAL